MNFEKELAILINKYSKENESDTPDFILAQYLKGCLANYTETVKAHDKLKSTFLVWGIPIITHR